MHIKRAAALILLVLMLIPMICSCTSQKSDNSDPTVVSYDGKRIGVLLGTVHDDIATAEYKNPVISYYNSNSDMAMALEMGKIDAYIVDSPVGRILTDEYTGHKFVKQFTDDSYAFLFKKDDARSSELCLQMNEFLKKCKEDGTIEKTDAKWFGKDESVKFIDMDGLTAKNGVLSFATTTGMGAPFSYIKDNQYAGYDIDIAVLFCREYGYGIDIVDGNFDTIIPMVSSGKCDFGAGCVTVTEERSKSILFSDPDYVGGTVLVAKDTAPGNKITSISQLAGARIGAQAGAAYDVVAQEMIPGCKIEYFNSNADLALALNKGKLAAYVTDEPIARMLTNDYTSQRILTLLKEESYAWAIPKVNANSEKLRNDANEFFAQCREDGTFDDMREIWLGSDHEKQKVNFEGLTGENGTLTMVTNSIVGAPFIYIKDNAYAGYDVDLAVRFCRAYGYDLKIMDCDLAGMFNNLAVGKCDFGACCISITEERKETMLFSDPYYSGGIAVTVDDNPTESHTDLSAFFTSIAESFDKTFIREKRYLLFFSGMGTTLSVVVLSLLFGTTVGFAAYLIYYRSGKIYRKFINILMRITENTPVVVILMILYYIIFGHVVISGTIVSIIGFTLIFAGSVVGVMKVGVDAVDGGQREAALALGYTEGRAFMKVILPQAAIHFLPGYKSAIVQLIKGTAIVGYIAVQDLTKVSDIVRSRTFEAFFPLIVTAILYFLMAVITSSLVKRIELNINPTSRKKIRLLKGVTTK